MNLPNKLTVIRMMMIPLFLVFYFATNIPFSGIWALAVFAIASFTDALDGMIARKYNLVTDFGKLMDPLADKILVISALCCLLAFQGGVPIFWGEVGNVISLIVIVAREFLVTSIRLLAAGKGVVIAADQWGKFKTVAQMVWICLVLLLRAIPAVPPALNTLQTGLFLIMMALTIFSGFNYTWQNRKMFADA